MNILNDRHKAIRSAVSNPTLELWWMGNPEAAIPISGLKVLSYQEYSTEGRFLAISV